MPITQHRLKALVDAATDYEAAFAKLREALQRLAQENPSISKLAFLAGLPLDHFLVDSKSPTVIAVERERWRLSHARNDRRQRLRRRERTPSDPFARFAEPPLLPTSPADDGDSL